MDEEVKKLIDAIENEDLKYVAETLGYEENDILRMSEGKVTDEDEERVIKYLAGRLDLNTAIYLKEFGFSSSDIADLIKETGKIEEYLVPEKVKELGLSQDDIVDLIKAAGNVEKYLTTENVHKYELYSMNVVELIEETGKIEEYLTPEKVKAYNLDSDDIFELIKETGKIEKYLASEKIKEYELGSYHIARLIEETGKIEEYLAPEEVKRLGLSPVDIDGLIKATGKIEEYLTPEKVKEYELLPRSIAKLIEEIGKTEEYLTSGKIKEYGYSVRKLLLKNIDDDKIIFKYIDVNFDNNKSEILKRMYMRNNDVVANIKDELLDEQYISTLGEDKINFIACFEGIQDKILQMDDVSLKIFCGCIDNYEQNSGYEDWTSVALNILNNIDSYSELLENLEQLEEIDFNKLTKILQDENLFSIKTIEDIENFQQIRLEKCDEWIKGNLEDRKKAILYKLFGQSVEYTEFIVKMFGEDIENIDDGDEKDYVEALKEIMKLDDLDVLTEMYDSVNEIELPDKISMEESIKSAYFKKYKDDLLHPKELSKFDKTELPDELKEFSVYDAGTEFKMLMTSIAAYRANNPEDYKKDWNRPSLSSRTFLCKLYKK